MSLLRKIVWFIEGHHNRNIGLGDIAKAVGISRFHATRLFGAMTGQSLMAYVRARRLSEAAKVLMGGAGILDTAIGAGYGSHEAFSRAFRAQFGLPPSALRDPAIGRTLTLTEPFPVTDTHSLPDQTPRKVSAPALSFIGISGHYSVRDVSGIPGQWQRFRPHVGHIDGQKGRVTYGISYNFASKEDFDYMSAVEVQAGSQPPEGLTTFSTPAHTYAVFTHDGHVSGVSDTWRHIYDRWLPASGLKMVHAASFERMDERFDSRTGNGIVEIWIPVL